LGKRLIFIYKFGFFFF